MKIDPYGLLVGHEWEEVGTLLNLVNTHQITRFVELGVHVGGLTAVMAPLVHHKVGFAYLAVEINPGIPVDTVKTLPVTFLWGDCLDPAIISLVNDFIHQSPNAFIYCDNGNKPKEFATYAPLLRPGDLIAAHDYGTEITAADVGQVVSKNMLKEVYNPMETRITSWRKL